MTSRSPSTTTTPVRVSAGIADLFLMHDRPIARPCDDSVTRVVRGHESVMRRARGYAPFPVFVGSRFAAGSRGGWPFEEHRGHRRRPAGFSQPARGRSGHASKRGTPSSTPSTDLCRLYRFEPKLVACDLHPDYASTRWALASGLPVVQVQHHQAHVAACAAENGMRGPYLGVAWDGTGLWNRRHDLGRGILPGRMARQFERIAHLRPFRLPGGEAAVQARVGARPRACCAAALGPDAVADRPERSVVLQMLARGINAPWTTSVGRLFDAVASMAGVAHESRFEGQAAMLLERQIDDRATDDAYPLPEGDWAPMIEAVHGDVARGEARGAHRGAVSQRSGQLDCERCRAARANAR